jgi:transcriptional regulator with XRE-family HTH domain
MDVTTEEQKKIVCQNIYRRRLELDISQQELAASAGVSQNMISAVEREVAMFSFDALCRVAAALKTNLQSLAAHESFSEI